MSLYFVAIEPHPELSSRIREIQKDFNDRFQSGKAYCNFPHITVIPPFMHDEQNESEVVGHFQKTVIENSPFIVSLKGFQCFPNKKNPVIFIHPEMSDALKSIHRVFNESMEHFNYVRSFNPHVTVAYRDLTPENFEKAWKEYEDKNFKEEFKVDKIGLYKHFSQKWNLISIKDLKKS